MNWNEGFSASYTYAIVDPVTWRDIETHDLVSGNVMKTTSGTMESADIEITEDPAEEWVRIYLNATQGYDGAKEALFTGLLQTPTTEWEGTRKTHKANCYSVLKPANDAPWVVRTRGRKRRTTGGGTARHRRSTCGIRGRIANVGKHPDRGE